MNNAHVTSTRIMENSSMNTNTPTNLNMENNAMNSNSDNSNNMENNAMKSNTANNEADIVGNNEYAFRVKGKGNLEV